MRLLNAPRRVLLFPTNNRLEERIGNESETYPLTDKLVPDELTFVVGSSEAFEAFDC